MRILQQYIAERQSQFARHAFFEHLEGCDASGRGMVFASGMAFWVMVFQDILRLNEARVRQPIWRKIARHHRVEDAGHDKWFLEDMVTLGERERANDLRWLFNRQNAPTRDATYALVSEVFRASDDSVRIALLLTLESAGHIFFENVARYIDKSDLAGRLRYFSGTHLEVERNHQIFEQELHDYLQMVDLTPALRSEAMAMVDRVYEAFHAMFSSLAQRLAATDRPADAEPANPEPLHDPTGGA